MYFLCVAGSVQTQRNHSLISPALRFPSTEQPSTDGKHRVLRRSGESPYI